MPCWTRASYKACAGADASSALSASEWFVAIETSKSKAPSCRELRGKDGAPASHRNAALISLQSCCPTLESLTEFLQAAYSAVAAPQVADISLRLRFARIANVSFCDSTRSAVLPPA